MSHFQNLKSSKSIDDCFGLGYVKGVEIDVGASGTVGAGITTGLQAAGGGGVETIYDFVNMDRQVYYYTFCSYGYNFGAGATAALSASVGFSGVNGLLTGIRYHGTSSGVNKFEGPSISTSHSLGGGIASLFGIDFSIGIGMSNSAYADFSGIGNLLPCPNNMVVIENGVQGYSFQVSGSLSAGIQAEIALAYSNNSVGTNSHGSAQSYKKFSNRRPLAGLRMATEIMYAGPLPGIASNLQGFDMVASTVALIYGFMDFSNCPGELPTIGTFHVGNITANSATSGGIIVNDSGSPITDRGVVWSTAENPTIFNNQGMTNNGSGIGEFTSNITGLNPNTTYYVKAYATNGTGTAYGQQVEFKTTTSGGTTLLIDDFENYNINSFPSEGGWVIRYNGAGNSYQYITDQYQNSGNKSFRLHGVSNWDARIINELSDTPSQVYFEVSFFSENINHNGSFGLHNPNVGTWGSGKIGVGFNNGFITVAGTEIMEYNPDIWNTVKVKADMINNKFSVWVNNVEYVTNQDYNYPDFQYTHFQLTGRNNSANNIVFYDDVKVWVE